MSYINSDISERRYTLLWHKYFAVLKLYFGILSYTFGKWRKIKVGDEWSIMIQASWPLAFCKFNSTGSCIENYKLWDDCLHRVCTHTARKRSFLAELKQLVFAFSPHLLEVDGVVGTAWIISLVAWHSSQYFMVGWRENRLSIPRLSCAAGHSVMGNTSLPISEIQLLFPPWWRTDEISTRVPTSYEIL